MILCKKRKVVLLRQPRIFQIMTGLFSEFDRSLVQSKFAIRNLKGEQPYICQSGLEAESTEAGSPPLFATDSYFRSGLVARPFSTAIL